MNLKDVLSGIGSVLGPVGSVVGSVAGSLLGNKSQQNANKANMELAKYKYEKDLEMWNRQNDYNTPSAQMMRYAQAGINPNLVVSQGNSGNSGGMPDFAQPEMKAYTGWNDLGMSDFSSQILQKYQLDNMRQQTASNIHLQETQANKNNADAVNIGLKSKTEYWNAVIRAKEAGLLDEYGAKKAARELDLLDAQTDSTRQNIEESKSRQSVNEAKIPQIQQEISESLSRMGVNAAKIREINAQIPVLAATANKLSAEERSIVIKNLSAPNSQKQKSYNEDMLLLDKQLKEFEVYRRGHNGESGFLLDVARSLEDWLLSPVPYVSH